MARTKRKVNPILPVPAPEVPKVRLYQTACYVRLSVEDSGKPGADTIEAQKGLVLGFVEAQEDMQFCGLYCDNGRTGTNFERPDFERLMDDVRSRKIDCIVVKDLSRFGRNYKETGNYLERIFPYLDVRFIAVNDSFDTLTAERTADGYIVPLKNIINEVYSKDIGRKSRSALVTKQQKGEFIGAWAAYGYQKCASDPHRIEPDQETAPVVREIFALRLTGISYQQIARKLNEREVPSPGRYLCLKGIAKCPSYANSRWTVAAVKKVLTSKVYLGHMVQGRKRSGFTEGREPYQAPESEWVIVRNTHEPLIEEETFLAVQTMAAEASNAYKERLGRYDYLGTTPNILRGLIFCADCKRPLMRYKSVTNRGKNRYYVYICPSHTADLASCPKKYLHETKLKEILWDTLRQEIALAGKMEKLARAYSHSARVISQEGALKREITAAKQAVERAGRLYDSLFQNYHDKLLTEREYTELRQQYQTEGEAAQKRLEALERQQQDERRQTVENPWLTTCGQFRADTELTEDMAHALIDRVEVDADNRISISLRYRDEYRALLQLLEAEGEAVPA
jgi:site-specific DNA recombinase